MLLIVDAVYFRGISNMRDALEETWYWTFKILGNLPMQNLHPEIRRRQQPKRRRAASSLMLLGIIKHLLTDIWVIPSLFFQWTPTIAIGVALYHSWCLGQQNTCYYPR